MIVRGVQHVIVPVAQCRIFTTIPWDVVTPHCHGLTRGVRRYGTNAVKRVQPCKLLHEGLVSIFVMLSHITYGNGKHCAHTLLLVNAPLICCWRVVFSSQVRAHSILLCERRWDENKSKLFDCSRAPVLREYSVHAGT